MFSKYKPSFATTIQNKKATAILPIIISKVQPGSTIYTDEHLSYIKLKEIYLNHKTVCHQYNFVNPENGVYAQHVESNNSLLKYEIKLRKGIKIEKENDFLMKLYLSGTTSLI